MCCFRYINSLTLFPVFYLVRLRSLQFILLIFFSTFNSIQFYILFELSLVPIIILIIGWGYQTERGDARLALIFYTITASMPLLVRIILLTLNSFIFNLVQLISLEKIFSRAGALELVRMAFRAAFLVKFPIFIFHL